MSQDVHVTRWSGALPPTRAELFDLCAAEGLQPYQWANAPYDEYAEHVHTYHKVLYVVQGSITFWLPQGDTQITLNAGDRLDLPPHVPHSAVVGPEGVTCLEGHLR